MPGPIAARSGANEHPPEEGVAAEGAVEPESLSVTHWFNTEPEGEPYAAIIRFTGRRIGVHGKPGPRDAFVKEETIAGIVPGSGPVSITTWVYGLVPGEWTVTADLIRPAGGVGARRASAGGRSSATHTLPRAAWSWRRWAVSTGEFAPVKTRWSPQVRLARLPAVIHGSWPGLLAVGVLVGAAVQIVLLARANVPVQEPLAVDGLALVSGLIGAKLWYVASHPDTWRRSIVEGMSVDGFLLTATVVAAVGVLGFNLPIGLFLDATAPALFFGVAIGRLGCFFTGCCAGRCTRSRWGVWSSNRSVGARRIPTQLLESAAGLVLGVATTLVFLGFAPSVRGATFVAALAVYVLIRQVLLRLRAEPHSLTRARMTAAAAGVVLLADTIVLVSAR